MQISSTSRPFALEVCHVMLYTMAENYAVDIMCVTQTSVYSVHRVDEIKFLSSMYSALRSSGNIMVWNDN